MSTRKRPPKRLVGFRRPDSSRAPERNVEGYTIDEWYRAARVPFYGNSHLLRKWRAGVDPYTIRDNPLNAKQTYVALGIAAAALAVGVGVYLYHEKSAAAASGKPAQGDKTPGPLPPAGVTTWSPTSMLKRGRTYRISVQPAPGTTTKALPHELQTALGSIPETSFANMKEYAPGSALPADWPAGDRDPARVRVEFTYTGPDAALPPMSNAVLIWVAG